MEMLWFEKIIIKFPIACCDFDLDRHA